MNSDIELASLRINDKADVNFYVMPQFHKTFTHTKPPVVILQDCWVLSPGAFYDTLVRFLETTPQWWTTTSFHVVTTPTLFGDADVRIDVLTKLSKRIFPTPQIIEKEFVAIKKTVEKCKSV